MPRQCQTWESRESRLTALACKFALTFLLGLPIVVAAVIALSTLLGPSAASAQIAPNWRLSWEKMSQDEPCPLPPDGTYCDATLERHHVRFGPLDVRYSLAH